MTLSERLQKAKTQRLIAAGKLPGEAALKPETEPGHAAPTTNSDPVWRPIEFDVQPTTLIAVSEAPAADTFLTSTSATATHHCPSCNSLAHVDMVDLVGHRIHVSCPQCHAMWHVNTENAQQPR